MQLFVDKVQKNQHETIVNFHVLYAMAGVILNDWLSRSQMIVRIKMGDVFHTIIESPDGTPITTVISVVELDGKLYLRTDTNKIAEDNLANLPFEYI